MRKTALMASGAALAGLTLLLLSCPRPARHWEISFYHWRQEFDLNEDLRDFLATAGVRRLYLRFFDVDLHPRLRVPMPVSELSVRGVVPAGIEIVPVVFVAERVLAQEADPSLLARLVAKKIAAIQRRCALAPAGEIQLDCDWAAATRERFFTFLRALRNGFPTAMKFSVTLRLHQLKFRERVGVPPVERATLMLYNMGKIEDSDPGNSIIDPSVLRSYVGALSDYPVPFDLALPIFRWGLVYRLGRLSRIVPDLGADELAASGAFRSLGEGRFRCERQAWICGDLFHAGDLLRLEEADYPVVRECLDLVAPQMPSPPSRLVLYHLQNSLLERFGHNNILRLAR
jgi:hypothetical protein